MRIACIYWHTSSVGGIATHLNSLRTAAMRNGDTFDILKSWNWKRMSPHLFSERKWERGGDTNIWIDGVIPQSQEGANWLGANYAAVYFGPICPHPTKAYPEPQFMELYGVGLPKAAALFDGYWDDYKVWAEPLLKEVVGLTCVQKSYATLLPKGTKVTISPQPFTPKLGKVEPKWDTPLLIWPNQWKNIKGITEFLKIVPDLPEELQVDLYSNGIRYYQLRTDPIWKAAVSKDKFKGFHGEGAAVFHGNVDLPEITAAYQRAWFTVNLQGMKTRKATYKLGSYNFTEVEALFYGACPILHRSTEQTDIPKDVYISVDSASQITGVIRDALDSGFALSPKRVKYAREFVLDTHLASKRYQDLRQMF